MKKRFIGPGAHPCGAENHFVHDSLLRKVIPLVNTNKTWEVPYTKVERRSLSGIASPTLEIDSNQRDAGAALEQTDVPTPPWCAYVRSTHESGLVCSPHHMHRIAIGCTFPISKPNPVTTITNRILTRRDPSADPQPRSGIPQPSPKPILEFSHKIRNSRFESHTQIFLRVSLWWSALVPTIATSFLLAWSLLLYESDVRHF